MRRLLLAASLMCAASLGPARVRAEEPVEGSESRPELILPGDRVVRPGEWIELRWTRAEAVSELEILLSLDGGRHYAVCISPQLDPMRCGFRWRVPETAEGDLRMRIRFNRGGREIEGPPAAPLEVAAAGRDQPLGLPPVEGRTGTRDPRPSGDRSESPGSRPASGVTGSRDGIDSDRFATSARAPGHGWATARRLAMAPFGKAFAAPRTPPMRS